MRIEPRGREARGWDRTGSMLDWDVTVVQRALSAWRAFGVGCACRRRRAQQQSCSWKVRPGVGGLACRQWMACSPRRAVRWPSFSSISLYKARPPRPPSSLLHQTSRSSPPCWAPSDSFQFHLTNSSISPAGIRTRTTTSQHAIQKRPNAGRHSPTLPPLLATFSTLCRRQATMGTCLLIGILHLPILPLKTVIPYSIPLHFFPPSLLPRLSWRIASSHRTLLSSLLLTGTCSRLLTHRTLVMRPNYFPAVLLHFLLPKKL